VISASASHYFLESYLLTHLVDPLDAQAVALQPEELTRCWPTRRWRAASATRAPALLFVDVDRFKQINDAHGHPGGDGVLREFARRLKACVRGTDTAARLAWDEFTLILEGLQS